jgi:hypothetical protein
MASGDFCDFNKENGDFEDWLEESCEEKHFEFDKKAVKKKKHEKMSDDPFPFLRATYFRWATTIEQLCPELRKAHKVLAVGDIHIENFGTWRDIEQRLVWGINDFDEAEYMPYAFDLVRLVTSARLATRKKKMRKRSIARAILAGYRRGIRKAQPTFLDEQQTWMNKFLRTTRNERLKFYDEKTNPKADDRLEKDDVPQPARRRLTEAMPDELKPEFATRRAGVGSLGRPRYIAVAEWHNKGLVVREAKMQLTSAWNWAHDRLEETSKLLDAARSRSRAPDPYLQADGDFVYRRIAADADKIEIGDLDRSALKARLFEAMGADLGAFHAGNPRTAAAIRKDLGRRRGDWLHDAAEVAEAQVLLDFKAWRKENPKKPRKKR